MQSTQSNTIKDIHSLEKSAVSTLNMYGWNLQWTGEGMSHWDAKGYTPKGNKCIIEMKFRDSYYYSKMLEEYKYKALMNLDPDIVKLYYVSDPKGSYIFHLNNFTKLNKKVIPCPKTTLWSDAKVKKYVYLLNECDASLIMRNN